MAEDAVRGPDLWQLIQAQQQGSGGGGGVAAAEQQDTTVLFVGSKGAGKSSLVNRFVRRDEAAPPKPTTALEYTHAKREDGKVVKVAHVWELGGGTQLSPLMDVVLTPETVHAALVVIVLDLGDAATVWPTLYFWLQRVKQRVADCFQKMQQRGSTTPAKMIQRMQKRFGEGHPDLEGQRVTIVGIPLFVVAAKYDAFRTEGPEYAKLMAKALRHLSHTFAASLLYTTIKDEREVARFRSLLGHLAFGAPLGAERLYQVDPVLPLCVWAGKDQFDRIGPPQGVNRPAAFVSCGNEEHDRWKAPFEAVFTPKEGAEAAALDAGFDPNDPAYAEPAVDAMRAVKNDELEQYRLARARRAATPNPTPT